MNIKPGQLTVIRMPEFGNISSAFAWLKDSRKRLRETVSIEGAVLVRGFPLGNAEDFAVVRDVLVRSRAAYREKATPRHSYGDDIFSSTDLPASQEIRLHNENSYTLRFPGIVLFGCLTPPEQGGATIIGRTSDVLSRIPGEIVRHFDETGWLLHRTYTGVLGLPWQTAFGTEDRAAVAEYCAINLITAEWDQNDTLRTVQRRASTINHPVTGQRLWFNHIAFWSEWSLDSEVRDFLIRDLGHNKLPFNTAYGDGSSITPEVVQIINRAYDDVTLREPWQAGDLLIIDNLLAAHGRETYQGNREILVAMGEPVDLIDCNPSVLPA
jgi:Taurine catabolism dioxygenase TauD, TfdA family